MNRPESFYSFAAWFLPAQSREQLEKLFIDEENGNCGYSDLQWRDLILEEWQARNREAHRA